MHWVVVMHLPNTFFFFGIIPSSDLILCLIVINTKIYGSNISVVV